MIKTLIFALLISLSSSQAFSSSDSLTGMWPLNEAVIANYEYYNQVSESDIEKFIKVSNKKIDNLKARSLAESIISASSCYQIDPVYLTALIKKESMFVTKAKSSTGAAGLTQMTGSGLKELKDQLGVRGNKYARKSNIQYFNSTTKRCLGVEWNEFEDLFFNKSNMAIKNALYKSPKFSIYAGALLLKVYLSNATRSCRSCDTSVIYKRALEQYNGDTNKAYYALKIESYVKEWMK